MSNKLVKSTFIYLIGNVFSRAITFFMLPLYTKYIIPADYGYYEVTLSYLTIVTSVLYLDIWNGILRFMYDKKDKYNVIYTGFIIFLISTSLYCLTLFLFKMIIGFDSFWLIFLYGIFINITNMYTYINRGLGNNIVYVFSGLASVIITVISNVVLIIIFKFGYESLYISAILGFLIQIIILELKSKLLSKITKQKMNKQLLKQMIFFSLPLCINSLSYWLLSSFNKVYISESLGNYSAGIYSIAHKFSMILTILLSCFMLAWQETAFSIKTSMKKRGEYFSNVSNKYIKALGCLVILILPAISIIFPYFINIQYNEAKVLIPICIIGTIFSIFSTFLGTTFGNLKKTKIITFSSIIGAIVTVIFTIFLTKSFGLMGANIALSSGFFVTILIRIFILKKFIPYKININQIFIFSFLLVIYSIVFNMNNWYNLIAFVFSTIIFILFFKKDLCNIIKLINRRIKNGKK